MNNTNNALETLVQRDKQIKKANDKLKASINELDAELETTTNALSTHANDTNIHTSKEELIQLIVDHLESLDLGITKEVVSVLPTENISDNTLYFVPNEKGYHNEYLYINDKWELVGSTETNFTDYYTKLETNNLLEGKANSVHTHVVSDITDFPTIPTKVSELSNDSGYITGVAWGDITSKPELSQVAISGSYSDLSGTPTIPTKTSELINDSGFLTSSSGVITSVSWSDIKDKPNFSTVATSGSYNDLSNKPTIPKVYNKTLTIQKNGTNVATFTSNSNTDVTADITVPTKVSELSNDSGFITGISWDKVTNKPTLATVATSGSYTDLSNTPTIPTKLSQLENDMGFGTGGGSGDTSDCVHKTGDEIINGSKSFTSEVYRMNNAVDRTTTPSQNQYSAFMFLDKARLSVGSIQHCQRTSGINDLSFYIFGNSNVSYGVRINSNKEFYPIEDNTYSLGTSGSKWKNVYATTFNGNLKGNADTATYSTTPATTDNSTRIATTAWVRTYVNSVGGSGNNTLGSSISAYWSTSSKVTSTQQKSDNRKYPECYSNYIDRTPGVGIIYSGAQLYSELNAYANATRELGGSVQNRTYITKVTAQATFSNPISPTGKYLCTTANTVSFRAYAPEGTSEASVIDYSATKSIFIRVE